MNLEDVKIEADARKLFSIGSVTTPEEFSKLLLAMEFVYQNDLNETSINLLGRWTETQYYCLLGHYVLCEDFEIRKLEEFITIKAVYRDEPELKAIKFEDGDYSLLADNLKCYNGMQIYGAIDVFNTKYIEAKVPSTSEEPKLLTLTEFDK